ncbi:MAG: phage terminase large subunit [Opitutaceae bacterium]|nr:phage terminase large subunit [Opitutaceae bacterium]
MPKPEHQVARASETDQLIADITRERLVVFAEAFVSGFRAAALHDFLALKLEEVAAGRCRRLCVSLPPRHGKTTLISQALPAFFLTRRPGAEVIIASYSAELAELISVKTRSIFEGDAYRQIHPPILDPNFSRSRQWQTLSQGMVFATGVAGGATGRGADLLIIDDPFKNSDEADSPAKQKEVWDWFCTVALTRLSPNGVILVVGTRWNRNDLIGRLTSADSHKAFAEAGLKSEAFESIVLPAVAESASDPMGRAIGQPLWPERWSRERLEAIRLTLHPRQWAALYQQRPAPAGGQLVDSSKIKYITLADLPKDLQLFRAWDLAVSDKTAADYSAGAYGGQTQDGRFFLVHMDRGRRKWLEQKERILYFARTEAANGGTIGIETAQAFKACAAELRQSLAGGSFVREIVPDKSKTARALPWMAKIEAGMFYVVSGGWNADFVDELDQFPNGLHDDQVDAVSLLYQMTTKRDRFLPM